MSRVPITIISLSRRSYSTVAAEASGAPTAAAAMVARAMAVAVAGESGAMKERVFWMRDPKTGNWIPENHFGDVDVAELRARLLNHKHRN